MGRLSHNELELLDFLCAAAYFRCRVKRLKQSCKSPLRRLRYAGLVGLEGFAPSPWAFNDWLERQNGERLIQIIETPAAAPTEPPAGPPEPEAGIADGGGADARYADAPPPSQNSDPCGKHAPPDRGAGDEPRPPSISRKIAQPRRDPTKAPPGYGSEAKAKFFGGLQASKDRNRRAAEERLDAGNNPDFERSAAMRNTMRQIQRERDEAARLADPIEQAKILIRRKTPHAVFGAEYSDPPGPKGKFYVGRQLMSGAELLAYAERLAA